MKKKLNQLINLNALLVILFLTFGCQEQEIVNEQEKQSSYLLTRINAKQIKENNSLSDKLNQIKPPKEQYNRTANRYDGVQFNLNLNEAAYIENLVEGYHSYTFSIFNDEDNHNLNNIVLVSHNGQDYEAYLTTYVLTEEERNQLNNGIELDLTDKVSMESFNIDQINTYSRAGGGCFDLVFVAYEDCDCHAVHADGGCTHPNEIWEWQEVPCPGGGGGGGSTGGSDGGSSGGGLGSGGGGGGSSSGGSDGSNKIPTTPMNPDGTSAVPDFYINIVNMYSSFQLSQDQLNWINNPNNEAWVLILNNSISQEGTTVESIEFTIDLLNFLMINDWKQLLRQAIANGITSTAELVHTVYKELSELAEDYPFAIDYINNVVDQLQDVADELFDTSPSTLDWSDLFGIWLFELGDYPSGTSGTETIYFNDDSITTESLKQQQGVSEARQIALDKIANNDLSDPTVSHPWTYGQEEFYDGMANGNLVTAFLGSYNTSIVITINDDGSYTLTFTITNTSGWDSATRFRIDNDGDGVHDGIFENTVRDDPNSINLGGNISQNWTWSEIVN